MQQSHMACTQRVCIDWPLLLCCSLPVVLVCRIGSLQFLAYNIAVLLIFLLNWLLYRKY